MTTRGVSQLKSVVWLQDNAITWQREYWHPVIRLVDIVLQLGPGSLSAPGVDSNNTYPTMTNS